MKHVSIATTRGKFALLAETRSCQAMKMVLRPGEATEPSPDNEHPRCEQWLLVLSGSGEAVLGKRRRRIKLRAQSLLLIEKGELHQIKNTGTTPLKTVNFYVPPAYNAQGEPRFRAKRPALLARLLAR